MLLSVNKSIIIVYVNYFDKENNNFKLLKMLERDREDVCLLCSGFWKHEVLWFPSGCFSTVAWLSPHVLAEQLHVQSSRERCVCRGWQQSPCVCVTVRVLDVSSFLRFVPPLLIALHLPPQMPSTAQRASSAPTLARGATPCPRASGPRWSRPLRTPQWRSKGLVPPGRRRWSWSSAESKGRGRRTVGPTTSRLTHIQAVKEMLWLKFLKFPYYYQFLDLYFFSWTPEKQCHTVNYPKKPL